MIGVFTDSVCDGYHIYTHTQTHRVHTENSGMQRQNNANAQRVYANKPSHEPNYIITHMHTDDE